ncbi:MAG: peptide ABC transporter substrate-binding protein [Planctomycetota bacterium]
MKKAFAAALTVVLLTLAGGAAAGGKALRFNNGDEPETLDPAKMTGLLEGNIAIGIFEGLTNYHPATLAPVPGVAERWEISDDRRTYTFHLRQAKWTDGSPVTAEDFRDSWRRVLEPATGAEYAYQLWYVVNGRAYNTGAITDFSKVGIEAPDARTLRVTLEHPAPYFLDLTSFSTLYPVKTACVARHGESWTRPGNIVTNGPFRLAVWRRNDRIVLERNPGYWDAGRVRLDRIEILPVSDLTTGVNMYEAGETDWIPRVPFTKIDVMRKRPDFRSGPSFYSYFYRFNVTRRPFNDARVRKALSLAIDRKAICEKILKNGEVPALTVEPPLAGYEGPRGLPMDLEAARRLLAEAGFPGGKGFPRTRILYNTSENHALIAQAIQAMWKANLGIEVELENQEWKVYLKNMSSLDFDIARGGWFGDYLDVNTFLDMFVTGGGNNRTGWGDKRYDDLVVRAQREPDVARRAALFREAEAILVEEALPVIPLYFGTHAAMVKPNVKGFFVNLRDIHPLKEMDIESP